MSEEHGADLHAERTDHYGSEKPAGKSMIKRVATVLFGLAVVGGALGGAGYWFYNQGQPVQDDGNLPILLPDPSPIKIRPEDPGGMEVPHRETTVYDQLSDVDPDANVVLQELPDMPRAPEVMATPKAAQRNPAPEAQEDAAETGTSDAPQTAAPETKAEPAVEAPEIAAPELTDAQKVVAAAEDRAAEAPAEEKAAPEPTPAPQTTTAAAAPGAFRVQLASVREESGAATEWKRLSSKNKDLLGNLEMFVQRVEIEGKGIFYRLQAGPLGDAGAAEKLCADLKERNVGCLIVRP
jgi:hypothetical protein